MSDIKRVTVHFDETLPSIDQGRALLAFELHLRQLTGLDVRVYKERLGDDSKLRVKMTAEERERL